MEHTGRYYEQIAQYLYDTGLNVSAVNPKPIKDYGDRNSLRHVNTDKADAKKIARYALDRWAELRQHILMGTICYQLKALNRQRPVHQDDDEEQSHRPLESALSRRERLV